MTDQTATIDENGRVHGDVLGDVEENAQGERRFWEIWGRKAMRPESYSDPKVVTGGGKHGAVENDPGYLQHMSLEMNLDGRGYKVVSSRPYLPPLSRRFLKAQDEAYADYLLTGVIRGH